MAYPPLGAALIVFGDQAQKDDPSGVLAAVRDAGFGAIECGPDFFGPEPAAVCELLRSYGLRLASLHGGLDLDIEQCWRILEMAGSQDLMLLGDRQLYDGRRGSLPA
jgi:sugar phosphate isomerase/epimerase